MNRTKSNKLIALFMGCTCEVVTLFEKDDDLETLQQNKWSRPEWMTEDLYNLYGWMSYENEDHMRYHTSWDWLMPVVDKIESLGYLFFISGLKIEYASREEYPNKSQNFFHPGSKLESAYVAVVHFIKWYNENK